MEHESPASPVATTDTSYLLVAAAGQDIVNRDHRDVLDALPEREVFVSALHRPATGHLAAPVDLPEGTHRVRRPRQSRT